LVKELIKHQKDHGESKLNPEHFEILLAPLLCAKEQLLIALYNPRHAQSESEEGKIDVTTREKILQVQFFAEYFPEDVRRFIQMHQEKFFRHLADQNIYSTMLAIAKKYRLNPADALMNQWMANGPLDRGRLRAMDKRGELHVFKKIPWLEFLEEHFPYETFQQFSRHAQTLFNILDFYPEFGHHMMNRYGLDPLDYGRQYFHDTEYPEKNNFYQQRARSVLNYIQRHVPPDETNAELKESVARLEKITQSPSAAYDYYDFRFTPSHAMSAHLTFNDLQSKFMRYIHDDHLRATQQYWYINRVNQFAFLEGNNNLNQQSPVYALMHHGLFDRHLPQLIFEYTEEKAAASELKI
jgi:hypothetical protein